MHHVLFPLADRAILDNDSNIVAKYGSDSKWEGPLIWHIAVSSILTALYSTITMLLHQGNFKRASSNLRPDCFIPG